MILAVQDESRLNVRFARRTILDEKIGTQFALPVFLDVSFFHLESAPSKEFQYEN